MPTRSSPRRWMRRWSGTLLLCGTLLLLLAGCSLSGGGGSSGGSSLSLGFAGSTADQPSQPPTLAQGGPGGTYAFVYDNQIWLRASGHDVKQLTHLVLSSGANIAWGPLVWSPTGKYIAFSLVQNLTPTTLSGSSGPIYVVDTSNGDTILSGGTGSIYGHTYGWYGDNMLFYSAGGAIMMFGPYGCGVCDPRTWTVLSALNQQIGSTYNAQGVAYGDLGISGGTLYYTQINLQSLGAFGVVGSAGVYATSLFSLQDFENTLAVSEQNSSDALAAWISGHVPISGGAQVADLGQAYAGQQGSVSTGAWDVSDSTLVVQHVDRVDTKARQVFSSFCSYALGGFGGCTSLLRDAGKASLSATPSLTIGGNRVAYTNGTLYVANTDGSHEAKLTKAGWTMPPAVSPDGKTAVATQLASQSTSASGVVHSDTNVFTFNGSSSLNFIPGGQDFAWKP